ELAPAGVGPGGTVLALPPPMYRQEAPRSLIFVAPPEQAVVLSISPENGGVAGLEKPAPPQPVVPAAVVYLSESPVGQVVVVVLDVDVVDVVTGALVDVVTVVLVDVDVVDVVTGVLVDVDVLDAVVVLVVEDPRQGLCAHEAFAVQDRPACLVQLSCVNCPHVGGFPGMQQAPLFVGFTA